MAKITVLIKETIVKLVLIFCHVKRNSFMFESHDDFSEGPFEVYKYLKIKNYRKLCWVCDRSNYDIGKKLGIKRLIILDTKNFFERIKLYYYYRTTENFIFSHRNIGFKKLYKKQNRLYLPHGQPFKFVPDYANYIYPCKRIVNSDFAKSLLVKSYSFKSEDIAVIVNPRNFALQEISTQKREEYLKCLNIDNDFFIALLTWSKDEASSKKIRSIPFSLSDSELELFNKKLKNINKTILFKIHPMYKNIDLDKFKNLSNIKVIDNKYLIENNISLYSLLTLSEGLITDFSSVFIDYYLTLKPIIFVDSDYVKTHSELFVVEKPLNFMAGPKCSTFLEIVNEIESFSNNPDYFLKERIYQKKLWFSKAPSLSDMELILSFLKNKPIN